MRRSRFVQLVALALAACGGAEPHDGTTPTDDGAACPSEATPGRCQELADAAATTGHSDLAWAYTVVECQSKTAVNCTAMWQRYSKGAPTQTDALNVLHVACGHQPAACKQLADWHAQRGHALAAATYRKRAEAPPSHDDAANTLALATDLAAAMHIADAAPRTDAIDQMIAVQVPTVVAPDIVPVKQAGPKAWPMHAAAMGSSSGGCPTTVALDKHPIAPSQCVTEVRPLDGEQIALRNRCSEAITVAFSAARANNTTYTNQIPLEAYEARSTGISHRDTGNLTYAVCPGSCRITRGPDELGAWNGQSTTYYCAK